MRERLKKSDEFDRFEINPDYITAICGGVEMAASIIRKAIYWYNKKRGGEFYKTDKEFLADLHHSLSKLRTFQRAKRLVVDEGFLEITIKLNKYGKRQTYYVANIAKIIKAIDCYLSTLKPNTTNAVRKAVNNVRRSQTQSPAYGQSVNHTMTICQPHHDKLSFSALSSNTANISSSSPPTPSEDHPVAVQEREEERNKHYGKSEQPGGSPVQPIEASVKPQALAANDVAIKPVDIKGITDKIIEICKRICPVAKVGDSSKLSFIALDCYKKSFNESFVEVEKYFRLIASSKLLMGEKPTNDGGQWDLRLDWMLSSKTIEAVRSGKYRPDREIPLTAVQHEKQLEARKQEIELQQREEILGKIGNSNQDDWVKKLYVKVLAAFGANGYYKISDGGGTGISQEDGHVEILTQTLEAKEFIEGRRCGISTFLLSLGMKPKFTVKTVCDLRREKLMALPVEDAKSPRKLGLKTFSAILEELAANEPKRNFANRA